MSLITGDIALDCSLLQLPLFFIILTLLDCSLNALECWTFFQFEGFNELRTGQVFRFAKCEHDGIVVISWRNFSILGGSCRRKVTHIPSARSNHESCQLSLNCTERKCSPTRYSGERSIDAVDFR